MNSFSGWARNTRCGAHPGSMASFDARVPRPLAWGHLHRAYGQVFTARIRAMGIRDRPIAPASPWQNGIAERLIGTLRRECLDQMVIFSEAHLRRILSA